MPVRPYPPAGQFFFGLLIAVALLFSSNFSLAENAPPVLRSTLHNGLQVIIVPNDLSPVATTVITYLVGSNEDPRGSPGMAHAVEHMMFRGSQGLSAGQLANIVAEMGGMFNAMTQATVTRYFLTMPVDDVEIALRMEATRMKSILSTPELWQPERGAIQQEVVRNLSDPEYVFYEELLAAMFGGTPYANSGLGTLSSFNRTTAAELKKFHQEWYAPNNALLVVAGNVEPHKVLAMIKEHFGDIPAKKIPEKQAYKFSPVEAKTIRLKTGNPAGIYILSFRMPGYKHKSSAASQILADVLSSSRGELNDLVIRGKALLMDFELMTYPDTGMGMLIAAYPAGQDPDPLVRSIKEILKKNLKTGFAAGLVESAKRKRMTKGELEKNSIQQMALAWSSAVAVQGRTSPDELLKEIAGVSPDDVNRVARAYLKLDRAVEAVLTPEASGKPVAKTGKGIVDVFEPRQEPEAGIPSWAKKALELKVPPSSLHPAVTVFPNGLKLIFQKQNVSDTVVVYGRVKNEPDLQVPAGKEGLAHVANGLFSFGTKNLDRTAFQKAVDEIGAFITAGTDFSLQALSGNFERGLQLLAQNMLEPAFPQNAFETLKKQEEAAAAGYVTSPAYQTRRALAAALYPANDPARRFETVQSVGSLTIDDAVDYYHKVFRPDMTVIVVIGNADAERVTAAVKRQFGGWVTRGEKPDVLFPPVPPNAPSVVSVPNKNRVQTRVILAQTVGITRTSPDFYALQLGNYVLGGAFYATRLYRDLREKTGLVYNVSPQLGADRTRAAFSVRYASNPENIAKARGIIEYNIKDMQQNNVPEDELRRAKALHLREIPLSESSVKKIAEGFIERTVLGLPLDEPVRAAARYLKMKPEEVRAAFEKWMRPGDWVQVTEGPLP